MQQAAIPLGVPLRLLAETASSSAAQVIADSQVGDYADLDTLRAWASGVDVVTFDHEHVPTAHLEALAVDGVACRPGPAALVHAQDKVVMRKRLAELEVPCPRSRVVDSAKAVADFAADGDGWPVVLKTATGGYDGKGVWIVDDSDQAAGVIRVASAAAVLLAEDRVDFVRELSAVVARAPSGQIAAYPVVETTQTNGVCTEVTSPAPDLEPVMALEAQQVAMTIAAELDVTGILAVELFETRDGRIMVNELAMRPHNTGHWTIDGAVTSQFENHLRAVLDLPLGSPKARVRWTVMVNILGSSAPPLFDGYLHVQARDPEIRVHLYGKDVTPGRKVGHVTAYGDSLDEVKQRARHAASWFEGKLSDDGDEG